MLWWTTEFKMEEKENEDGSELNAAFLNWNYWHETA